MALAIALGTGFLVLVGAALATPGFGILSAPVHSRGTLGEDQVSTRALRGFAGVGGSFRRPPAG